MALVHLPNNDPAASPLLRDLSRLPPLFITATTTEVLLDDSLLLALQATRQGVTVKSEILPNLFLMWHMWPDATPQAARTLRSAASLLGRRCDSSIALSSPAETTKT